MAVFAPIRSRSVDKKFYGDEADEPVFELTTAAERAIQWLEDLQARPFVGAESRLELIFR